MLATSILLAAACTPAQATTETNSRPLGPGEHWLPLAQTEVNGTVYLCTLDNRIGGPPYVLRGDATDPRFTWALYLGNRYEIGWPRGFSVRFSSGLQVLDENDFVVATGEDNFNKMCPTADSNVSYLDLSSLIPRAD